MSSLTHVKSGAHTDVNSSESTRAGWRGRSLSSAVAAGAALIALMATGVASAGAQAVAPAQAVAAAQAVTPAQAVAPAQAVTPAPAAAAAQAATPGEQLSPSNYSVRAACPQAQPGYAACAAQELVPRTAQARARTHLIGMDDFQVGAAAGGPASKGEYGLRPQDVHSAYDLPNTASSAQTIALVDAYDDPTAESDLKKYDEEFSLPACTTANHCFRKINEEGKSAPLPEAEPDWDLEISLDIEMAHATCENCHIMLVEANSSFLGDLEPAVNTAVAAGATEISNSYGGADYGEGGAYNHPGVVITASTGDLGYDNTWFPFFGETANYPASSPDVVAVGGTTLTLKHGSWAGESAWAEAGSGCSPAEAPSWQLAVADWSRVGCGTQRADSDISADADPDTGVAVYDTSYGGWVTVGGTSVSSPVIASAFALAGGADGVEYPAQTLYSHLGGSSLHDVLTGTNGGCLTVNEFGEPQCTTAEEEADCANELICNARAGYDGPTGIGTPDGLGAFRLPSSVTHPTVTSITPSSGTTAGGTAVTIRGTNLGKAAYVHFGSTTATITKDSAGSLTAISPAHTAGKVSVTVTNASGGRSAESSADAFTYTTPKRKS